jgi:hypothetical protein
LTQALKKPKQRTELAHTRQTSQNKPELDLKTKYGSSKLNAKKGGVPDLDPTGSLTDGFPNLQP